LNPLQYWSGCRRESIEYKSHPRTLALKAINNGHEYIALLESGGGLQSRSRYSIVGIGAVDSIREDDWSRVYDTLSRFLNNYECSTLPCRELAFIAISYESVVAAEPWLSSLMRRHEWPLLTGFKPETLIIYDHVNGRAITCGREPQLGDSISLESFRLGRLVYETGRSEYEGWVREVRELIAAGEAFQVVVSRVKRYEWAGSLYTAYDRLAKINPSPYMFYMRMGDETIAGTSPELLVKLDAGVLETHPIAGTRPRGRGAEDLRLEEELLSDEKELAEHIMLIDLARNDLTSVSKPGTTRVSVLMDIEKYSHVQHIVSRVESRAREGLTFTEAVKATLPAGTVSGAPKPRAMEIIARLEDLPRGPYAGAVGVGARNAGEVAITIRSYWTLEGLIEMRAGAGIVYDSIPEREYMETEYKLGALKRALGG